MNVLLNIKGTEFRRASRFVLIVKGLHASVASDFFYLSTKIVYFKPLKGKSDGCSSFKLSNFGRLFFRTTLSSNHSKTTSVHNSVTGSCSSVIDTKKEKRITLFIAVLYHKMNV